jgi:hypothetical protein
LARTAVEQREERLQLVHNFIRAFDNVPQEERNRLMGDIWSAVMVLRHPEIVKSFGDIVFIKTNWSKIYASYWPVGVIRGERFHCSIKLKNMGRPLLASWSTDFPEILTGSIREDDPIFAAVVNIGDLLEPVYAKLSIPVHTKILFEFPGVSSIGESVVMKLTDMEILKKIALESPNAYIRGPAVKKLTDQEVLVKIALDDISHYVRDAAVMKLTDQAILAKIAKQDKAGSVREAATRRIAELRDAVLEEKKGSPNRGDRQ